MKLTTSTKPLLAALDAASLAISPKIRLPMLTCALVECSKDGTVSVTCDSLDARMTVTFEGAKVDEPFRFLAAPRLLKAALRGDEATLTFDHGILSIVSGGKSKLTTINADEFPNAWPEIAMNQVEAAKLINGLKMACNCASPDASSADSCVFWDKETTHLFGTDRKSLSAYPVALDIAESFILPAVQAKIITSCFEADELAVGKKEGAMELSQGNKRLWIRLREGNILPHKSLLVDGKPSAYIERETLKKALSDLAEFSDTEYQKITVTPSEGDWMAFSQNLGNESTVNIAGAELVDKMEPFTFSRNGVYSVIQHWTCDRIAIRRGANVLMLTPEDESGAIGIASVIRPS